MIQRRAILAACLLFSFAAFAQNPAPLCPGAGSNPQFTVAGNNPVLLTFTHLTSRTAAPAQATVSGNTITVVQIITGGPQPPALLEANCNVQTVSLGALPAGTYSVVWSYALASPLPNGSPQPVETYTFSFVIADVPALSGAALFALMLLLPLIGVAFLRRS